jgi:hypothetical protein
MITPPLSLAWQARIRWSPGEGGVETCQAAWERCASTLRRHHGHVALLSRSVNCWALVTA